MKTEQEIRLVCDFIEKHPTAVDLSIVAELLMLRWVLEDITNEELKAKYFSPFDKSELYELLRVRNYECQSDKSANRLM